MKRIMQFLLPVACALSASPALAQSWDAPPRPPAGAAPNLIIPAHDSFGRYQTPNQELSAAETSWHVRAALNVAALACRDRDEAGTVASYNRMLGVHRASLTATDGAVKAQYRARYGAGWQSVYDRNMTRLYNFFAQPPAQAGFCTVARELLAEAMLLRPGEFDGFAAQALPRLEAPFIAFYRQYDDWRVADTAWRQGRYGQVASAAGPLP